MTSEILVKRTRAYLEALPPAIAGQHGHDTTFRAAAVLVHGFALPEDHAWPLLLEYNARCQPPWSERDLRRKLSQAATHAGHLHPRGYLLGSEDEALTESTGCPHPTLPPPSPKPVYQPDILARLANKVSQDISPAYLEARSKYTCWNRSPAGFLHKLYRPGERVILFKSLQSQGCEVWEHPGIVGNLATLDHLGSGCRKGVWFTANPVDGHYHWNPREEKESRRSEESVTAWRYVVIESDQAPAYLWLKALVQLPLPIASIATSGGSSVHALVRVDAESKAQWGEIVRGKLLPILVPLGADPAAMTAVRLSRLPGCIRGETGRRQTLLYLDDERDSVPICQKPFRERLTEADYARRV